MATAILEVVRVDKGKKQCLQEQCFVDRSHVVATAILEVVRVDKGKMLSTEQCCVDRNILGGRPSSWGGLECLSGRPGSLGRLSKRPGSLSGRPGARLTWPQGGVLSTGAMSTGAFLEAVPAAGAA